MLLLSDHLVCSTHIVVITRTLTWTKTYGCIWTASVTISISVRIHIFWAMLETKKEPRVKKSEKTKWKQLKTTNSCHCFVPCVCVWEHWLLFCATLSILQCVRYCVCKWSHYTTDWAGVTCKLFGLLPKKFQQDWNFFQLLWKKKLLAQEVELEGERTWQCTTMLESCKKVQRKLPRWAFNSLVVIMSLGI